MDAQRGAHPVGLIPFNSESARAKHPGALPLPSPPSVSHTARSTGCWTHRRPLRRSHLRSRSLSIIPHVPFFFFFSLFLFPYFFFPAPNLNFRSDFPLWLGGRGGASQALSGIIVSGNTNFIPDHPLSILREFGSDAIGPASLGVLKTTANSCAHV